MKSRSQNREERDLFDQIPAADKKIYKKAKFFLPRLKNNLTISYENIIFVAIGAVMACIIFFSLGVEKGRQDIGHTRSSANKRSKNPIEKEKSLAKKLPPKKAAPSGKYIIQVAAFKKKGPAKQELGILLKDKYKADVKKTGDYYQLFIYDFKDKEAAEKTLNELKGRYKDCYIRKAKK